MAAAGSMSLPNKPVVSGKGNIFSSILSKAGTINQGNVGEIEKRLATQSAQQSLGSSIPSGVPAQQKTTLGG